MATNVRTSCASMPPPNSDWAASRWIGQRTCASRSSGSRAPDDPVNGRVQDGWVQALEPDGAEPDCLRAGDVQHGLSFVDRQLGDERDQVIQRASLCMVLAQVGAQRGEKAVIGSLEARRRGDVEGWVFQKTCRTESGAVAASQTVIKPPREWPATTAGRRTTRCRKAAASRP